MAKVSPTVSFMELLAISALVGGLFVTVSAARSSQRLNSQAAPLQKVMVCHVPPGNPSAAVAISVSLNAWLNGHDPHKAHSLDYVMSEGYPCPPVSE